MHLYIYIYIHVFMIYIYIYIWHHAGLRRGAAGPALRRARGAPGPDQVGQPSGQVHPGLAGTRRSKAPKDATGDGTHGDGTCLYLG